MAPHPRTTGPPTALALMGGCIGQRTKTEGTLECASGKGLPAPGKPRLAKAPAGYDTEHQSGIFKWGNGHGCH
jgi:hypothetical protein